MSIMIVIKMNRLILNLNQRGSECTFGTATFLWFPKLILGQDFIIFCGSDCAKEDDSDDDKGTVDDDSSWDDDEDEWENEWKEVERTKHDEDDGSELDENILDDEFLVSGVGKLNSSEQLIVVVSLELNLLSLSLSCLFSLSFYCNFLYFSPLVFFLSPTSSKQGKRIKFHVSLLMKRKKWLGHSHQQ